MRRVNSGDFIIVNKHLLKDLVELGLWNETMKNKIIAADGSIQNIEEIPQFLRELYKTVWEIKQKVIIDLAADRGAFICQSQSMNIHLEAANNKMLSSMHMYAWEQGLKTGTYYLRTKAAISAQKITIEKEATIVPIEEETPPVNDIHTPHNYKDSALDDFTTNEVTGPVCSMEEGCISCSG
jgi:ribonucleoside-diphosphate reductase alpha chain